MNILIFCCDLYDIENISNIMHLQHIVWAVWLELKLLISVMNLDCEKKN